MSPPRLFQQTSPHFTRTIAPILARDLRESREAEARFARRIAEFEVRYARLLDRGLAPRSGRRHA
jgi:hypothetical protein